MSIEIVTLEEKHVEDAAELVAENYRLLRRQVQHLPARYEESSAFAHMIQELASQVPGVGAIEGGRLAGFCVAMVLPSWWGMRTAYSPEWANGADVTDSRRSYQEMYTRLSAEWVADGCLGHALTLMAHDPEAIDTWHWLGFGLGGVDGVRDLAPVLASTAQVEIRRAGMADVEEVMALDEALRRHLASAPTFLPLHDGDEEEAFRRWLGTPDKAEWLAYQDGQVVASMTIGPANENACHIIRDGGTASIVGAFTKEAARGRGIGSALLNRSLAWASREGYVRCAVDFEPHNIQAARFWPRYFEPVCYSLVRRVGEYATGDPETV